MPLRQILKPLYLKDMPNGNGRNGTKRTRTAFVGAPTKRRQPLRGPDRQERKFFDTTIVATPVIATGAVQSSLVIIPQGTTESDRVGRKIRITSVHYRGLINLPSNLSGSGEGNDVVRMILVQDKQVNGSTFNVSDYLEFNDLHSFRNLSNVNRFHTLYDRQFQVDSTGAGGTGDNTIFTVGGRVPFQFHKNVNIPIEYNNVLTTGVVSTQTSNGLFLLFVGQEGTAGVVGQFRVRFTDGA